MSFLSKLDWRRAVKHFDPSSPLTETQLSEILRATQMAPSSLGLQPYHVFVVRDQATKEKIQEIGYNQAQYTEAPVVLVFVSHTDLEKRIEDYVEHAEGDAESLAPLTKMMKGFIGHLDETAKKAWADRQTYLALGFAMAAAAELGVHSCAMEGFVPAKMDEILELPAEMKSVAALTLGHTEAPAKRAKFRFPQSELFTEI